MQRGPNNTMTLIHPARTGLLSGRHANNVRTAARPLGISSAELPLCDALKRFDTVFQDVEATSPDRLAEVFRLRYRVYCLEREFEAAERHANGHERDAYDDGALHSLLVQRATRQAVGTVRLVRPDSGAAWTETLPLAAYAAPQNLAELAKLPAESTAEVSRFAIARTDRRRIAGQPGTAAAATRDARLRRALLPHLSLGLVRGLVRLSLANGISHWCLAAEPALLRRLKAYGLHFTPAGPLVDHRGLRQVCYAELASLLDRARSERPDHWSVITAEGRLLSGLDYPAAA